MPDAVRNSVIGGMILLSTSFMVVVHPAVKTVLVHLGWMFTQSLCKRCIRASIVRLCNGEDLEMACYRQLIVMDAAALDPFSQSEAGLESSAPAAPAPSEGRAGKKSKRAADCRAMRQQAGNLRFVPSAPS